MARRFFYLLDFFYFSALFDLYFGFHLVCNFTLILNLPQLNPTLSCPFFSKLSGFYLRRLRSKFFSAALLDYSTEMFIKSENLSASCRNYLTGCSRWLHRLSFSHLMLIVRKFFLTFLNHSNSFFVQRLQATSLVFQFLLVWPLLE